MDAFFASIANRAGSSRRDFLRGAVAGSAQLAASRTIPFLHAANPAQNKTIVVTFGGGARDQETFAPQGQENIPHLIHELVPQGTFCTQVINQGILGHYVATASIATGSYETFDNFTNTSPSAPTVFEYFRKGLHRPAADAWVIAPSNGFNRIGQSDGSRFATGFGAQVILPKLLLAAAAGEDAAKLRNLSHLLMDSYENPFVASSLDSADLSLERIEKVLHLSLDSFLQHAQTLASADELSVFVARQIMQVYAPSLIWITLHDMDVAHTGSFSLYLEAIQRTDRLCSELWQLVQGNPEYKGRTSMLVLPDFGRDSDFDVSGNGFQHHRTGDPLSRTTWMLALGPRIRENATLDRPLTSLDIVPTIGAMMGFPTPLAHGKPISEIL